jgi:hypothetical protein
MQLEEMAELLTTKELTMSEIQEIFKDHSVLEISRYVMTSPQIRQTYGSLCDNHIRFTASSGR